MEAAKKALDDGILMATGSDSRGTTIAEGITIANVVGNKKIITIFVMQSNNKNKNHGILRSNQRKR